MKKRIFKHLQLLMVVADTRVYCYWCGQKLKECGTCKGHGNLRGEKCKPCMGHGSICPTHEGDWDE